MISVNALAQHLRKWISRHRQSPNVRRHELSLTTSGSSCVPDVAQAPLVAAAFGSWPGFVLMLITILALFTVSLVTAVAIGRTALDLFG